MLRQFFAILGGRFGALLVSVVATPILVRLLGDAGYGDFSFMLSLLVLSMVVVNAGIFDGTRKFVAERRGDAQWVADVISFYGKLAGALIILAWLAIFILLGTDAIAIVLGEEFEVYFVIVAIIMLTKQFFYLFRSGLMGVGKAQLSEPLYVLEKGGGMLIGIGFAYIGYGVAGVLVGYLIAAMLAAILAIYHLRSLIDVSLLRGASRAAVPRDDLLSFNLYTVGLTVGIMSLFHLDIILVRLLTDGAETGHYKAALLTAEFLLLLPVALQILLVHGASHLWSDGESATVSALLARITRLNLAALVLLAAGVAVLADPFFRLYFGPEFTAAIGPFLILLPGVIGFGLARPLIGVGQATGAVATVFRATAIAAVANLVLNLLLIPPFGMYGAAVATAITYASMIALLGIATLQRGINPFTDLRAGRILVIGGITVGVLVAVDAAIASAIVSLVVVPIVGVGLYGGLLFVTRVFSADEIDWLRSLVEGSGVGR